VGSGIEFIYGFTGQETDAESDLMYYDARYYDPPLGRFVSEDPIGFNSRTADISITPAPAVFRWRRICEIICDKHRLRFCREIIECRK
jgi:RHS repeat-associated protein